MPPDPAAPVSAPNELYRRTDRHIRRLAIFGPRGTGKTCFFASLYGHSADEVSALTFDHDPTMEYLERMWNAYESKAGFPAPTPSEVPQRLLFHLAHQASGQQWETEILDHAGEFVERIRAGSHKGHDAFLRDIVRTWLRDCEATLIFLDSSRGDGDEALERRNEVAILLQLCREASETGRVNRPLGLVLTKWDGQGSAGADPTAEAQRAREYLARTPAFRQIHATVEAFGSQVEVYPVSAIGWDRQASRKPQEPFNLLAPLLWALQQTDEGRWRAAETLAEQPPRSLGRAVRAYQDLIDADRISSGPVHERVVPRLEELRRQQRRRRQGRLALAAATVLTLLVGGWTSWSAYANRQYQAWVAFCGNEGAGEASARKRADLARDLLTWHGLVLDHNAKARLEQSRLRDPEVARDDAERLEWDGIEEDARRAQGLDDPQRMEVLGTLGTRLEQFGKTWQGQKVGRDWPARLEAVKAAIVAGKEQCDRYNRVVAQEGGIQGTNGPLGVIRLWEEYLKSEPQPTDYYTAKAGRQLAQAKNAHDRERLNALVREAGRERFTLEQCTAFLRKIDDFKRDRHNKELNGQQLEGLIEDELATADGAVYEEAVKAVEMVRKSLKVADLRSARSMIQDYIADTEIPGLTRYKRPVRMHQAAAQRRDWFDEVIRGKKYKLTLRSLFVPEGQLLFDNTPVIGTPAGTYGFALTLSGAVGYDTQKGKTFFETPKSDTKTGEELNDRKGVRVSLDAMQTKYDPGTLTYKLGDAGLKVKVGRHGYRGWWFLPESQIDSDLFIPAALQRGWEIMDENKKPLTLFIDCDGADIPTLPPFQGRKRK